MKKREAQKKTKVKARRPVREEQRIKTFYMPAHPPEISTCAVDPVSAFDAFGIVDAVDAVDAIDKVDAIGAIARPAIK
ncbi:hypothetical protein IWW52_003833, partial [Coemansia sp. RSA 2704]